MSATAAFLKAWNSKSSRPALLCQIDLATPSARSLYLSNREVITPDGQPWEPSIIDCDGIRLPGDFLATGPDLASGGLTLNRRRLAFQASGDLLTLLSSFYWQGATVTLWYWEMTLAAFSDRQQIFSGAIDTYETNAAGAHIAFIQRRDWMKSVPTAFVTKAGYPSAPEANFGVPIPIVYGSFALPELRSPWPASVTANRKAAVDAGRQMLALPGITVDRGLGANALKALFASHPVFGSALGSDGSTEAFIDAQNPAYGSRVDSTGFTQINAGSEFGLTLADDTIRAFAVVLPIDVRAAGGSINSATDPRNAMDVSETTYAQMDDVTHNKLELVLPDLSTLGVIVSVEGIVGYSTSSITAGKNLRLYPLIPGGASGASIVMTPSSAANLPKTVRGTWDGAFYHNDWRFSTDGTNTVDLVIDFAAAPQTARIYFVALVVKYRPTLSLVSARASPYPGFLRNSRGRLDISPPAIYELGATVRVNASGYADTGGGTYTGIASALIQLPPDIMRHFLVTYGSLVAGDFELSGSTFGSFVDARAMLSSSELQDVIQSLHIGTRQSTLDVVRNMAAETLSQVFIDSTDGKFKIVPWRRMQLVDYSLTISKDEILGAADGLRLKPLSDVGLAQSVRIKYGLSPADGRTLWDANVSPGASDQGFADLPTSDQLLQIISTNKVLKFDENAGTLTATMNEATYLGIDMAVELQRAIRAATADTKWWCGWGTAVKAGFNDTAAFDVGAATLRPTVASFSYSPEALCAAVQKAMNAIQGTVVFTISYSRATGKVTVAGTGNFTIHNESTESQSIWATLGFAGGATGPVASSTAANQRLQETFHVTYSAANGHLLWTNVGATCAAVLGFVTTADQTVGSGAASYRRGDRQTRGATSVARYGEKREMSIASQTIIDYRVAAWLRDLLFDFSVEPRCKMEFATHRCPDLERARVFATDSSLDDLHPYARAGSDGTWAGKAFRVTEVVKHAVTQWHQDVVGWEIDPMAVG